jgi:site-specific DNA recombinase
VRLLKQALDRRGVVSKLRAVNGQPAHAHQFSRGALYVLLANPLYIGEVRHRGVRHLGQHQPIVERELWERVQRQLHDHAARRGQRPAKVAPSPLVGKLFDENGQGLTPSHARKGGRRYRYYVSRELTQGPASGVREGWRLPAPEFERAVAATAGQLLGSGRRSRLRLRSSTCP